MYWNWPLFACCSVLGAIIVIAHILDDRCRGQLLEDYIDKFKVDIFLWVCISEGVSFLATVILTAIYAWCV